MVKKFILLLVAAFVSGQQLEQDSIMRQDLEDIVVVASRSPKKISEVSGTVWVVPKSQIIEQAKGGVPLKEMLSYLIPGLDVGPQGRTNFGQNMRGRATLVMIDGVSLNSLRAVSRQFDAIDPFNIERIEVLSGASSIYGGNATGGIINIITKTPDKKGVSAETAIHARSGFMGENDLDYRISQSIAGKGKNAYGRLGISYQQNGAIYGGDNERVIPDITQTDLQFNQSIDVMGTFGYKINHNHEITGAIQYYNSKFNGDEGLSLGENFAAVLTADPSLLQIKDGFTSDDNIGTERYLGTVNYHGKDILGGQDVFLQVGTRGEYLGFHPFPKLITLGTTQAAFTSASEQNTNYTNLKLLLNKDWGNFNLSYGADADFEKFNANQNVYDIPAALASGGLVNNKVFETGRYPNITANSYAGFLQGEYDVTQKLKLSAGVRYQKMNIEVEDFIGFQEQVYMGFGIGQSADVVPGGKSDYDVTLANAGILYKFNQQNQTWFNFSQGVGLADPAKLYGVGFYQFNPATANWDLQTSVNIAEQPLEGIITDQFELGYRNNSNNLKAQISGFYSKSNKNIGVQNDGQRLVIFVEDLKLRNMGIEAEVMYKANNGAFAGVNTLLIKSEKEDDDKWVKQSIFTASPSKLNAFVGYNAKKWSVRLQHLQTFDLEDEDKQKIDAYSLLDLLLSYKLGFAKINVGVQNLLNKDYQTVWSQRAEALYSPSLPVPGLFYYRGRGRTFNATLTFDF